MKNKPFRKQLTTLVMGLIIIFSAQKLALSSNNQELTHAEALGDSKLLIAQSSDSKKLTSGEKQILISAVSSASSCFGQQIDALTADLRLTDIPDERKNFIARVLSDSKNNVNFATQSADAVQTKSGVRGIINIFTMAQAMVGRVAHEIQVPGNIARVTPVRGINDYYCLQRNLETIGAIAR